MTISQLPRLPLPQESLPEAGLSYPLQRRQELKPLVAQGKSLSSRAEPSAEEAKKAANQFESFFLYLVLKEMDKTIDRTSGLFGDSTPDKFMREMYYEELAGKLTESGGVGLSKMLMSSLASKQAPKTALPELRSISAVDAAVFGLQSLPK
jgi:Rod binding domain-containing protein